MTKLLKFATIYEDAIKVWAGGISSVDYKENTANSIHELAKSTTQNDNEAKEIIEDWLFENTGPSFEKLYQEIGIYNQIFHPTKQHKIVTNPEELIKYMILLNKDGSIYYYGKDQMVGGTQENPILDYVKKKLILPQKPIGEVFYIRNPSGFQRYEWFKVIDPYHAKRLDIFNEEKLNDLLNYIDKNSWISEDFVKDKRIELEKLKKSI